MSDHPSGMTRDNPLTFQWNVRKFSDRGRLFIFLLASLFVHAGFFYLVRVASNEPTRSLPSTGEILLLHHSNPNAAPILQRVHDQAELSLGSLRWAVSNTHAPPGATYRPTFFEHELRLERLPKKPASSALGHVFAPGFDGLLPELPPVRGRSPRETSADTGQSAGEAAPGAGELAEQAAAVERGGSATVSVSAGGRLSGREIIGQPDAALAGWDATETGRVVFFLGVERSGRVGHIMLVSDSASSERVNKLKNFVGGLVFDPAGEDAPEVVWGPVEIRW